MNISNASYRFFRVTEGPLIEAIAKINAAQDAMRKTYKAVSKEFDGDIMVGGGGFIVGVKPKPNCVLSDWKKLRNGLYVPKKTTQQGKDWAAKLKALPKFPMLGDALNAIGLSANMPVLIEGDRGLCNVLGGFPDLGIWFVRVPWCDVSKKEIAEYKREKKAGNRFSLFLDHLCWTPHASMKEVKEWEYLKEWDELKKVMAERERRAKK